MAINVNITPIFKQIIGDAYHFELLAVNEQLQSNTVGFIVVNRKTGEYHLTLASAFTTGNNEAMILKIIEQIKEIILTLEKVI